jgi:hypothetical protein
LIVSDLRLNTYENLLKTLVTPSFEEIYRLNEALALEAKAAQIIKNRELHLNIAPLPILQRGLKIIENELELISYFYVYSKIHAKKLRYLYEQYEQICISQRDLFLDQPVGEYTLIDWGCGQGIGSMLFLEHLLKPSSSHLFEMFRMIRQIICIEPSALALNRSVLHLSEMYQSSRLIDVKHKSFTIKAECLKLDEVGIETIGNETIGNETIGNETIRSAKRYIHIFSNILDIEDYDQKRFYDLMSSKELRGWHDCLIVSPNYGLKRLRCSSNERVDQMIDYFRCAQGFQIYLNTVLKLEGTSDSLFKIFSFKID